MGSSYKLIAEFDDIIETTPFDPSTGYGSKEHILAEKEWYEKIEQFRDKLFLLKNSVQDLGLLFLIED